MLTCNFLTWTWFHYCLHTRPASPDSSVRPWAPALLTPLSNLITLGLSPATTRHLNHPSRQNCLQAKPPWHSQNSEKPLQVAMLLFKDFGIIKVNRWDAKLVPMTVKNNPAQLLFPPATSVTTKPHQPSSPPTMSMVGTDIEVETQSMKWKCSQRMIFPDTYIDPGSKSHHSWMLLPLLKLSIATLHCLGMHPSQKCSKDTHIKILMMGTACYRKIRNNVEVYN